MKQHFVMLASDYDANRHNIANMYASEKLDGIRALWDGGISRGLPATEIPWANTQKHSRFVSGGLQATGLWTRYGQPIQAPDWFLDQLPPIVCDGELWAGRGQWQATSSIVKATVNVDSARWRQIRYMVFDMPAVTDVFEDRSINIPNMNVEMKGCYDWINKNYNRIEERDDGKLFWHPSWSMCALLAEDRPAQLHQWSEKNTIQWVPQVPINGADDPAFTQFQDIVEKGGGEGLMLRHRYMIWKPERSRDLLKVKKRHDMEGTCVGYVWGRRTDRGSKLLGKMGAMLIRLDNGIQLELSGFTDAEREMSTVDGPSDAALAHGVSHPGEPVPDWIHNPTFPRGCKVTFKYRELSNKGVPKEAHYWRQS